MPPMYLEGTLRTMFLSENLTGARDTHYTHFFQVHPIYLKYTGLKEKSSAGVGQVGAVIVFICRKERMGWSWELAPPAQSPTLLERVLRVDTLHGTLLSPLVIYLNIIFLLG